MEIMERLKAFEVALADKIPEASRRGSPVDVVARFAVRKALLQVQAELKEILSGIV